MKALVGLLVFLLTPFAFATDLQCTMALETSFGPRTIVKFANIETPNLVSDLPDQDTLEAFVTKGDLTSASFSNECDNMYEVSFPSADFGALLSGQKRKITGHVDFGTSDGATSSSRLDCQIAQ
jgi:hypothetical protein